MQVRTLNPYHYEIVENIEEKFDENGIAIPQKAREVRISKT